MKSGEAWKRLGHQVRRDVRNQVEQRVGKADKRGIYRALSIDLHFGIRDRILDHIRPRLWINVFSETWGHIGPDGISVKIR